MVSARVTIGATTPYLRVGACNPDPRRMNHGRAIPRPMPRPQQVRPVIIFQDAHCIHLRMPDGRCIVQPRRQQPRPNPHYNAGYNGGYDNYGGGGYRDPYERYVDPRSYGPNSPSSRAVSNPMNGSWEGFRRNPANAYMFGGQPRRY